MHLPVVRHAVVDGPLHVPGQVGHDVGADGLRRGRLERLAGEHALEPRHPLLEDLLRRVLPVQHAVLERDAHLVAVGAQQRLCGRHAQGDIIVPSVCDSDCLFVCVCCVCVCCVCVCCVLCVCVLCVLCVFCARDSEIIVVSI